MRYLAVIVLLFAAVRVIAQHDEPARTLPEFLFSTLDGHDFTAASLPKGSLTFFLFFDSDCDHCQRAARHVQEQLSGFTNCTICVVSLDSPQKITGFLAANAPLLRSRPGVIVLHDVHDQFRWRFHPYHYPGMFLYSPEGKLLDYEDNEETVFRITGSIRRWVAAHHT